MPLKDAFRARAFASGYDFAVYLQGAFMTDKNVLYVSDPHGEFDMLHQLIDGDCGGLCQSVDEIHVVGDVYDRGPAAELIMDQLLQTPSADIQWGNHDVVWMGAALGQRGCIAHVVRNCARYGNLSIMDAYGIDYTPLKEFALQAYADDPCVAFGLKSTDGLSPAEVDLNVKIQKAMAIIQFKVEGQLIDEYPEFGLQDRKLLDKIDYERGTVVLDGVTYPLADTVLPTVNPLAPYELTAGEEAAMAALEDAFKGCERLQAHMRFILERGSLYRIVDNLLLFHACVPLRADGSLMEVDLFGRKLAGKALFDEVDARVRAAFSAEDAIEAKRGRDLLWYLWLGSGSPLFAKNKMATFEIYFIADKAAKKEVKNPFYFLLDDEAAIAGVFADFGMDPATSRIVCGHVPVKVKDGEDPVRCGGKVVMIDGGMSAAYRKTSGIGGMALLESGDDLTLCYLEPLDGPGSRVRFVETRKL